MSQIYADGAVTIGAVTISADGSNEIYAGIFQDQEYVRRNYHDHR
jgi:hypothetical protein